VLESQLLATGQWTRAGRFKWIQNFLKNLLMISGSFCILAAKATDTLKSYSRDAL
jgi:hypothetical protein